MNREQRRAQKFGNLYNSASKKGVRRGGTFQVKLVKLNQPTRRYVLGGVTTLWDIKPNG